MSAVLAPAREARALGDAHVLVVGAGGLGCPALLSLGARGARRVTVLEPDRVELSNLHRQILYAEADVGASKAERCARSLRGLFPAMEVEALPEPYTTARAGELGRYDAVLDGTDHFETKLALADGCVDHGVPFVFAGVVGYEGQVLAVRPGYSACPRCLFDEAPPPGAAPTCAELGILGPVAGVVAAAQVEALARLLAGDATVLDRLWTYDGRLDRARVVGLARAADCQGCGDRAELRRARRQAQLPHAEAIEAPVVDLTGLVCPATFTATRRALERLPDGGRLWVYLSSDESARSVPKSALAAGHRLVAAQSDGRTHRLLLEKGVASTPGEEGN